MKMIFSRPWTDLYFKSRENRSVIDPDYTGHRGFKVGTIEKVFKRPDGKAVIRFITIRALEKHDGLQIEIPKLDKPFGFPVEFLQAGVKNKFFEISAGSTVDIILPKNSPLLKKGLEIFCSSSQAVKRKYTGGITKPGKLRITRPLEVALTLSKQHLIVRAVIKAQKEYEKETFVSIEVSENFTYAKDPAEIEKAALQTFEKLGGTPFILNSFTFNNPYKMFVPVSKLNQIRRQVVKEAEKKLEKIRDDLSESIKKKLLATYDVETQQNSSESVVKFSIKTDQLSNLSHLTPENAARVKEIILDISNEEIADLWTRIPGLEKIVGEGNVRLALPAITRSWEKYELKEKINRLLEKGYYKWQVSNLSGFEFLSTEATKTSRIKITSDWPIYVANRFAAQSLFALGCQKVALSPESSIENLKALSKLLDEKAEVIAYQDTPLFISESCPKAAVDGKCPPNSPCNFGEIKIESGKLGKFIIVSNNCRTVVVSEEPFGIFGKIRGLRMAGAVNFRVDFINRKYGPREIIETLKRLKLA
jgi:putative protease